MAIINGDDAANNLVGTAENDTIDGMGGNDRLTGAAGDDILIGGLGADIMAGGAGNDIYVVDNVGDATNETSATGGTDLVRSVISYALRVNVENLTLLGGAAINGTGNGVANTIIGNGAANILDGLVGADRLEGLDGNDTYIVDNAGDVVVEASATGGTDVVRSVVSFLLGANIENLVLTGGAATSGTGNALNNDIQGNAAANALSGAGGNDVLNGQAGADTMRGGAGNDHYFVDNIGDRAVETSATAGGDLVSSTVSFTLGANVEELVLLGSAGLTGTGNSLNNTIIGNSGANNLNGGGGNDRLEGAGGIDTMRGGVGNDTYVVINASDRVIEGAAGGNDIVLSSVSYSIGANVEDLTLQGTGAINGTGNALANDIIGNGAANVLTGGAGNDTLTGGAGIDRMIGGVGNDVYIVDNSSDIASETSATGGIDRVESSVDFILGANVENLTLTGGARDGVGNALDNVITGNDSIGLNVLFGEGGDDVMDGRTGEDTLYGGVGNDVLRGGAGPDQFVFDTALNANTNVDDILDFSSADDVIFLNQDVFTAIANGGTLSSTVFVTGTQAGDADDRIIYDPNSGNIFYDADGSGATAAILFAQVTAGTTMSNTDFIAYDLTP